MEGQLAQARIPDMRAAAASKQHKGYGRTDSQARKRKKSFSALIKFWLERRIFTDYLRDPNSAPCNLCPWRRRTNHPFFPFSAERSRAWSWPMGPPRIRFFIICRPVNSRMDSPVLGLGQSVEGTAIVVKGLPAKNEQEETYGNFNISFCLQVF